MGVAAFEGGRCAYSQRLLPTTSKQMTTIPDPTVVEAGRSLARRFFYPTLFVAAGYTLLMHFAFPCTWAVTPMASAFVEGVADAVPMLAGLKAHGAGTPCFLLFVAGFWCISPVFFAYGALFLLCAPPSVQAGIRRNRVRGYVLAVPFFAGLFLIAYCIPSMSGRFNDGTDFLPLQLLSWCIVAVILWLCGLLFGSVWLRFVLVRQFTKG